MSLAVYLQHLNVGMVPDQTISMTIGATIHITNEWKCFRTPRLFRVSVLFRRISISLEVLFLCYCSDCFWRWAKCKPQCRRWSSNLCFICLMIFFNLLPSWFIVVDGLCCDLLYYIVLPLNPKLKGLNGNREFMMCNCVKFVSSPFFSYFVVFLTEDTPINKSC